MLRQQNKVTNQKVRDLENFVDELDDRLRDQEAYTRKDSMRIMNPPLDASRNETLANIKKFFERYLDIKCITESRLVAYHVVPSDKPTPARIMPSVIIKFVHSHKNALVMKNRRKLKGIKNPLNEKNIYINEPLGPVYSRKLKNVGLF